MKQERGEDVDVSSDPDDSNKEESEDESDWGKDADIWLQI